MKKISQFSKLSLLSYKGTSVYTGWVQISLVQFMLPAMQIFFFLLVRLLHGNQTLNPQMLAINNLIYFGYLNLSIFIVNSIGVERSYGTIAALILSPISTSIIFFSKMVVPLFVTTLCQYLLVLFLGVLQLVDWSTALFLQIFLANVCFSSFSILLGVILLPIRKSNIIVNALGLLVMFTSGINFSLKRLPSLLSSTSYFFPLVYARKLSDYVMDNRVLSGGLTCALIVLTFGYLLTSILLASRVESFSIRRSKLL